MAYTQGNKLRQVIGPRLRNLLRLVFLLFALLAVNSVYLISVALVERVSGESYQDFLYLMMFLLHLLLGLILLLPLILFGALHLRNAWPQPNRYAKRAGLSLYITALLLLLSGVLLTRFGFFEVNDQPLRQAAYWVHVLSPLGVIWLFVLHRLAGSRIRWRIGGYWTWCRSCCCCRFRGEANRIFSTPPMPRRRCACRERSGLPRHN